MQKRRCFYQPQIEPATVSVQPGGKKEGHFGNQKAVPAYVFGHVEPLEQFQALGPGQNRHSCLNIASVSW
jgi:hypothetical protein